MGLGLLLLDVLPAHPPLFHRSAVWLPAGLLGQTLTVNTPHYTPAAAQPSSPHSPKPSSPQALKPATGVTHIFIVVKKSIDSVNLALISDLMILSLSANKTVMTNGSEGARPVKTVHRVGLVLHIIINNIIYTCIVLTFQSKSVVQRCRLVWHCLLIYS